MAVSQGPPSHLYSTTLQITIEACRSLIAFGKCGPNVGQMWVQDNCKPAASRLCLLECREQAAALLRRPIDATLTHSRIGLLASRTLCVIINCTLLVIRHPVTMHQLHIKHQYVYNLHLTLRKLFVRPSSENYQRSRRRRFSFRYSMARRFSFRYSTARRFSFRYSTPRQFSFR